MKILNQLTILIILSLILIQNVGSMAAKKDIKYEPSKDYVDKVSMIQEIDFCIEICTECVTKTKSKVNYF